MQMKEYSCKKLFYIILKTTNKYTKNKFLLLIIIHYIIIN